MTSRADPGPASDRMRRQATRDTLPERRLRSELWRRGLRYRLHRRPEPGLRRWADLLFVGARVAVMVDGCQWHGCDAHYRTPKTNPEFWDSKIEVNRCRDRDTNRRLTEAGWCVIRVWEHEAIEEAADRVEAAVRRPAGGR